MKNLFQLRTRVKLIIGFTIIVLSIFGVLSVVYLNQKEMARTIEDTQSLHQVAFDLQGIRSNCNRITILYLGIIYNLHNQGEDAILNEISLKKAEIETRFDTLESNLKDSGETLALLSQIKIKLNDFLTKYDKILESPGQHETPESIQIIRNGIKEYYDDIRVSIKSIEEKVAHELLIKNAAKLKLSNDLRLRILILGAILISLTIGIAYWSIRLIRKITEEIRTGIDILGTSSNEILTSVTQISAGAAETATAVSETTTTIEEVRQTAMISNQKAQSLLNSSQKASDSAEKGRNSINHVIESMNNINKQMEAISSTVARLTEHNRVIAEITSTVADIADQSNLLAVNAAIEAAKAGEQGRGFTILAQEIRSLADQSKRATIKVKEIINEVNKSAGEATGVTESGSKTVEEGIRLVSLSGEVIEILAENVNEATEAALQISSSTRQQMAGMDQIVPAMENIKKASEQNAQGINLTQTSVQNIHLLGRSLKSILVKYKL
jgi:methyl-accepting chemotaxis protein